jgi:hypothetical protein
MSDIASPFDNVPSKDGGATSELSFDDLIPTARLTPGFFEMMMHGALASATPGYPAFNGPVPASVAARKDIWPQTSSERSAQATESAENTQSPSGREPGISTSVETADQAYAVPRQLNWSIATPQIQDVQPGNGSLAVQNTDHLEQPPGREALQRALQAGGLSPEEASYLASQAANQRASYGLIESAAVPNVPSRMNLPRTAEQRLQDRLRESETTSSDPKRSSRAPK